MTNVFHGQHPAQSPPAPQVRYAWLYRLSSMCTNGDFHPKKWFWLEIFNLFFCTSFLVSTLNLCKWAHIDTINSNFEADFGLIYLWATLPPGDNVIPEPEWTDVTAGVTILGSSTGQTIPVWSIRYYTGCQIKIGPPKNWLENDLELLMKV